MRFLRKCLVLMAVMFAARECVAQDTSLPPLMPPPQTAVHGVQAAQPAAAPNITPAESLPPLPGAAGELPAPTPADSVVTDDDIDSESLLKEESYTWYEPMMWFGPAPWDSGIELGVNGSSGTSESLSIRTGGYIKRESRFSKLDFNSYYNGTTNGGVATQNNAQLDVRNDWLLSDESPWTLYGTGNVFYDEFQAFDLQISANTGVGYRFVHEPALNLMCRFGGGTSREFGGPDDRWVPESLLGFEYGQQLSQTQKFSGKLDYYPEWEEFGEYRLVADAGWEIELVQPSNVSLKISATDRYDSTPNGANPHLVNYSVLLLLKL